MIFWLNSGFDGDITSQKCCFNGSSGDIVGISSDTVTNLYQQSAIVQEVGFKQQSSGGSIHGCVLLLNKWHPEKMWADIVIHSNPSLLQVMRLVSSDLTCRGRTCQFHMGNHMSSHQIPGSIVISLLVRD
jgi:hypothetical protein